MEPLSTQYFESEPGFNKMEPMSTQYFESEPGCNKMEPLSTQYFESEPGYNKSLAKDLLVAIVAIWIVHGLQRVLTSPHLIIGSEAFL